MNTTTMYPPSRAHPPSAPTRGFTLVELMISLAIGLFLVIGLVSLLVSNVRTRSELDRSAGQIENGRYALALLSEELQHAGFLGETSRSNFDQVLPTPCVTTMGDLGYAPATSGGPTASKVPVSVYALTASPGCSISNVATNTALLVVTRVSTTPTATTSLTAGETYLQVSACATDVYPFAIDNTSALLTLRTKDCATTAQARKVIQRIYYLSTCDVCSGANADTKPTLKMAEYVGGAMTITPLVEGIQDLQFDYGIDMNGDGSPDCYVSNPGGNSTVDPFKSEIDVAVCPQTTPTAYAWTNATTNWSNVVAVRIHALARSLDTSGGWKDTRTYDMGMGKGAVGPFNDAYKRHAYSVVASLYNKQN